MEQAAPDAAAEPSPCDTLVVVIHGLGKSSADMAGVATAVRAAYGPGTQVYAPDLPHGRRLSFVPAARILEILLAGIDAHERAHAPKRIVLVGHSIGATLARRLFLVAAGNPSNFAPEDALAHEPPRAWAPRVERIVMLAAFSRGWRIGARLRWRYAALFNLIGFLGHIVPGPRAWVPTAFDFRLGAPFMAQTRLHWLAYRRNPPAGLADAERPILIQMLGTEDDLISPVDQVDLAVDGSGQAYAEGQDADDVPGPRRQDYFLIEMPYTDHADAVVLAGDAAAAERGRLFADALRDDRARLGNSALDPAYLVDEIEAVDAAVRDTVFVIHGIRDDGYWTHRVAERVRQRGGKGADDATVFRSWTTSYGYFAMLPFVLPWIRREKVEWFADQYVTAFAQYPRSNFHFVGHSNGTYLAARALADYPAIHFRHVLFAGSVVRRDYRWVPLIDKGRVLRFQNLVAAGDGVVALLPKSVDWIPAFDLGGAGFDGFRDAGQRPGIGELKYLRGGHGAGIREDHWDAIARFVVDGTAVSRDPARPDLYETHPDPTLAAFGRLRAGLGVVALIGLLLCLFGYKAAGAAGLLVAFAVIRFIVLRV